MESYIVHRQLYDSGYRHAYDYVCNIALNWHNPIHTYYYLSRNTFYYYAESTTVTEFSLGSSFSLVLLLLLIVWRSLCFYLCIACLSLLSWCLTPEERSEFLVESKHFFVWVHKRTIFIVVIFLINPYQVSVLKLICKSTLWLVLNLIPRLAKIGERLILK